MLASQRGAARELLLASASHSTKTPLAGPSRSRHSSTAVAASNAALSSSIASSSRQSLAQIRNSTAYVARYRTLGPSAHPLLSSAPTKASQAASSSTSDDSQAASSSSTRSTTPSRPGTSQAGLNTSSSERSQSASAPADQLDDAWAFGGGAKSQGGPVAANPGGTGTSSHPKPSSAAIVMGNAGKGAVANYGKRKITPGVPRPSSSSSSSAAFPLSQPCPAASTPSSWTDQQHAHRCEHRYSPSTRSDHPLAQHTYFSSPSSSFNASSFVAPGTQPPLAGTATAGVGQGHPGIGIVRKKTALIFPGQGSQYVAMSKDLYKAFRSARSVWHQAQEALMMTPGIHSHHFIQGDRATSSEQRERFEAELAKTRHLDPRQGLLASGTAVATSRRGWLRDLVFSGDQLELTRAENAQPAILTCTLAFLQVLRKEFSIDLVQDHVQWAAGHGSGVYAALVGSGAMDLHDAVRLLRHRGLVASHYTANHPVLFPPGCKKPESIYETWAFANAGHGKGADLLYEEEGATATNDETKTQPGWKRTQMSGVVVRPGKLDAVIRQVEQVANDIRNGKVPSVARDEVVEVANINSQLQIVLSGTLVGVSYCCDRLRSKNLGARAVNLPVSGAYHSSLMLEASDFLRPAVKSMPLSDPQGLSLVSSKDGSVVANSEEIRQSLAGAFTSPVHWLSSVDTLLAQGVERFVCLGPGRACAHLLSKELAYRDKQKEARGDHSDSGYEVWSLATVEDVEQLAEVLADVSKRSGLVPPQHGGV